MLGQILWALLALGALFALYLWWVLPIFIGDPPSPPE
jgi:hypothetical protein